MVQVSNDNSLFSEIDHVGSKIKESLKDKPLIWRVFFRDFEFVSARKDAHRFLFQHLFLVDPLQKLEGLLLLPRESKNIIDGDNEEWNDENSPEADDDAHDSAIKGFGE